MDQKKVGPTELAANTTLGTKGYISQIVNGLRPLHIEAATQVARYLEVGIDEFSPRLAEVITEAFRCLSAKAREGEARESAPNDDDGNGGETAKVRYVRTERSSKHPPEAWPFKSISPQEFDQVDPDSKRELEAIARGIVIASRRLGKTANG